MRVGERTRSAHGYAMAALLVAMGVISVVVSTTLPVFSTMARREREAELVFRGEQYARAVTLFQRKYTNALPPNLDVLLNERFLRKQYKDPITGGDFQLVGPGSPELAEAVNSAPGQQQPGRGGPQVVQQQQQQQQQQRQQTTGRGSPSNALTAGTAPGGVLGVVSKSKETSLRLYNNRDKYSEWVFIAQQRSLAAGGPPGTQVPGGRGGAPLGGGRDGRGRRGEPSPDGRGRFGPPPGNPGGNRGGFGGPGMGPIGPQGQPARGRF